MNTLERIRAEQVKNIYGNAATGMVATLFAVAVLTALFVYLGVADITRAIWFIGLMIIQTLARVELYHRFKRVACLADEWQSTRWHATGQYGAKLSG